MAQQSNIVFPPNSISNPGYNRFETLLTVQDLKKRYLFGVEFKDNNGNTMEEVVYQDAILDAMSQFEHEFNLTLTPTTYIEKRDYIWADYRNWGAIQLNHCPIQEVKSVKTKISNVDTLSEFPVDWVRVYSEMGKIQLTPTQGTYNNFNLNSYGFMPHILGYSSNFPQLFEITYVAGFEQNKIPRFINSYIGLNAAIPLLLIAGDLIIGAGISSQSISLDGLSQSVNSTLSAENNGYGGRIRVYKEELKETTNLINKYYSRIPFTVG